MHASSHPFVRPLISLAGAALCVLLTGCQMLPSKSGADENAQGLDPTCVERCELARSQCEQRQDLREQECQTHIQHSTSVTEDCSHNSYGRCLDPVPCLGAEMQVCKVQHDQCLHTCASETAPQQPEAQALDGSIPEEPAPEQTDKGDESTPSQS